MLCFVFILIFIYLFFYLPCLFWTGYWHSMQLPMQIVNAYCTKFSIIDNGIIWGSKIRIECKLSKKSSTGNRNDKLNHLNKGDSCLNTWDSNEFIQVVCFIVTNVKKYRREEKKFLENLLDFEQKRDAFTNEKYIFLSSITWNIS